MTDFTIIQGIQPIEKHRLHEGATDSSDQALAIHIFFEKYKIFK